MRARACHTDRMRRVVRAVGGVDAAVVAGLAHAARLETLEEVLRARFDVLDVVVQDEYTHDVVTRTGADVFVVFDTT